MIQNLGTLRGKRHQSVEGVPNFVSVSLVYANRRLDTNCFLLRLQTPFDRPTSTEQVGERYMGGIVLCEH